MRRFTESEYQGEFNLKKMEKELIQKAAAIHSFNRRKMSKALGITERTLYRKLYEHGLKEKGLKTKNKMKGIELYTLNLKVQVDAGMDFDKNTITGTVCGFENPGDCVIIKVEEGEGWPYEEKQDADWIEHEARQNDKGYWYVSRKILQNSKKSKLPAEC